MTILKKANIFNDNFSSPGLVDDSNARLPSAPDVNRLENIVIRERAVFDALPLLISTKASSPDLISPRLLKEASRE